MQVNQWARPRPAAASAPSLPPHAPAGDPPSLAGLPGGSVGKNLPASSEDTDLIAGLGRFHMLWSSEGACRPQLVSLCSRSRELQLLAPHATATEPECPRAGAPQQEKPLQGEASAPELESRCRSPGPEKRPHGKDPAQTK